MMRTGIGIAMAVALVASPGVAQAQRMSVQTFLAKVAGLKQKGMMALFSSDVGLKDGFARVIVGKYPCRR